MTEIYIHIDARMADYITLHVAVIELRRALAHAQRNLHENMHD